MGRRTANSNHDLPPDLTVQQVAAELQVDVSSVYRLVRLRILPAYCPLGQGIDDKAARRCLRVTRADLDRHKAGNGYQAPATPDTLAPRRRPKLADHAEHQEAMAWMRARGIV
ncbi:MAG: helix-turn-helix domain-containing protein [Aliidongia sp.]